MKILVVENDPSNLDLTETLLRLEGHEPDHAENGAAALVRLALSVPDAILLDLLMPGMSGVEFLRELYAHPPWRGVPVLVLTAAADDEVARAREAHPGVRVLQKPAEPGAILRALEEVRAGKGATG